MPTTPVRTSSVPSRSAALAARPVHEQIHGSEVFARLFVVEAMLIEVMGEWYRNQNTEKRDGILEELWQAGLREAEKMRHPGLTANLNKFADEFIAAVRAAGEPAPAPEEPQPEQAPATKDPVT